MHYISSPEPHDIICGRGNFCSQHPGNEFLSQLVDVGLPKYMAANSKSDKSSILREIIRTVIRIGGRFLKKDSVNGAYYEAGMKAARDKVGYCLREASMERISKLKLKRDLENQLDRKVLDSISQNESQQPEITRAIISGFDPLPDPPETTRISENQLRKTLLIDIQNAPSHSSYSEDFTSRIDALFELPAIEGPSEHLILPREASRTSLRV
mmetsp:Transcript_11861/g.18198  ORF Transcript_11861/g.18198 Transcript_11861/m.18198 type:complete len:212 (-) Transcript_11861:264-899(-)|eukprot:CAMPEP_0178898630 /NCGR_PEP_ID=MMETSP0786-20121207/2445_1 /TAXON_ID=186022 /ORGANISM="Thalassionema frauenfeldii, Strain CCMP 1798" /LENGTH=211 /DNA_ID=CAMNT_0020569385 /DNA_START=29 /DNA_END=664 /DNA_ORIENTATION=-